VLVFTGNAFTNQAQFFARELLEKLNSSISYVIPPSELFSFLVLKSFRRLLTYCESPQSIMREVASQHRTD
jgi:hypothetical protein